VAKVGTSNPDRTISLKRLQCVVENKHKHHFTYIETLLHVSALRGPFSGSTDTFREQDHEDILLTLLTKYISTP